MIEEKYVGFVLNKTPYKDNDAIINILTSDGIKSFKATGINKINSKNASKCNYFLVAEYVLQSKNENGAKSLKNASIIKMYMNTLNDLLASSCYLFIISILKHLEDVDSYDLALSYFDKLNEGVNPLDVVNHFLSRVIISLGYSPLLNGCVLCGRKTNIISFNLEDGGFICNNCFNNKQHIKYETSFLKEILYEFKNEEISLHDINNSKKIFMMFSNFLIENLGINKESYDFILKCL